MPVLITPKGAWYRMAADADSFAPCVQASEKDRLLFSPDPEHRGFLLISGDGKTENMHADVIFPVLHGTYGEDGTLQGLLELANVPYVGCGVLASAVGMDKVLMKKAFLEYGLKVGPFFWFLRHEWQERRSEILEEMQAANFPLFGETRKFRVVSGDKQSL